MTTVRKDVLDATRARLRAKVADLEAERRTRRKLQRKLNAAESQATYETNRGRSFLLASGIVDTLAAAEAIDSSCAREQLRALRNDRDSLKRDLESAREEWRHHIDKIAAALGEVPMSRDKGVGVAARAVIDAAAELLDRARTLSRELERERGIVDALVRKGEAVAEEHQTMEAPDR